MFLVFTSSQPFLQDFPKDSMGAEQRHVDWPGAVEGRLPKRSPAGSPALSLKESWGFMGSGCIMKISLISLTKTKKEKLKKNKEDKFGSDSWE